MAGRVWTVTKNRLQQLMGRMRDYLLTLTMTEAYELCNIET